MTKVNYKVQLIDGQDKQITAEACHALADGSLAFVEYASPGRLMPNVTEAFSQGSWQRVQRIQPVASTP